MKLWVRMTNAVILFPKIKLQEKEQALAVLLQIRIMFMIWLIVWIKTLGKGLCHKNSRSSYKLYQGSGE